MWWASRVSTSCLITGILYICVYIICIICIVCMYIYKVMWGLPRWLNGKESPCQSGGVGLISGSVRSPGEGNGSPLQYSCLGNPMDRGAWWATVHRVAKSRTQLSTHTQLSETSLLFLKDLMLPWSLLLPPSLDDTIHKTTSSLGCFWLRLAVSSIQTVSQGTYYLS